MPEELLNIDGGIPKSLLKQITASSGDVLSGKKILSSSGKLLTGTLANRGQYQTAGGIGGGGDGTYYAFNDIPEGVYRKNGATWAPEVRYDKSKTLDYILSATSVSVGWKALAYNSGRYQVSFSVSPNKVYLVVAQCGTMDGQMAYTEMVINPSHKKLIFYEKDYTQDHVYMNSSIKVCVFKALASGNCYAAGAAGGDRAVSFVGIWRLVP